MDMQAPATPELIAHRGWASRYPENTLEAIEGALSAGARYVEFDVQLTADGVPVLFHDSTLDRTAGRPGCVHDMAWEQLRGVGVGEPARFGDRFESVRPAELRRVIDSVREHPAARAFVEIKTESLQRFGIERVLGHCLEAAAPAREQCVVTSYCDELLVAARRRIDQPVAWVLPSWDEGSLSRARDLAPEYLFCSLRKLPAEGALPTGPWDWAVYEIVDPILALELAARGVRFVETMRIGEMLTSLLSGPDRDDG
jgi:glycerophosphoryl diester phosphodiesterase